MGRVTDDPATRADLGATVASSSLSTAFWVSHAQPQARGVVTLWHEGRPTLAFTYADADVARELAASGRVGLAFTETRGAGQRFRPLLATGSPTLVEDPEGTVFREGLLEQELRRFPPARLLADSPLLRREHWWYLPRLLVHLDMDDLSGLPPDGPPREHFLVTGSAPEELRGQPTGVVEEDGDRLLLDVDAVPGAVPRPAVLFGQDASFPDLERWSQWRFRGVWDGDTFAVSEAPVRRGLAPVPGVLARWRRHRALERACRQALAAR